MPDQQYGALAEFPSAHAIYHAAQQVRDAGYMFWDTHTPYPVHGLPSAMGLRRSPLGWIVLVMALAGAGGGLLLQWWVSAVDYPLIISGKPLFSWQAFVPIIFELMVLFAALGAVFGMFHFNRLPQLFHPVFRSERFDRASDDKFFITIESRDPKFDADITREFLRKIGAEHVELLKD